MPRAPKIPKAVTSPGAYFQALQPFLSPVLRSGGVVMSKIVSPMLPVVPLRAASLPLGNKFYNEVVMVTKDILTSIGNAQFVTFVKSNELKRMKTMLPRVELFVAMSKAMEYEAEDINAAASRITSLAFNRMKNLRRLFEEGTSAKLSKYVLYGRRMPAGTILTQHMFDVISALNREVKSQTAARSMSPHSFGFVIDFSAAGGLGEFLGSFFMALGRNRQIRQEIRAELSRIKGIGKFKITAAGIVKETKAGVRSIPTRHLQSIADKVIERYIVPSLNELFYEVVEDFFLREPTSVSRWFPARPMSRKGLKDRKHSLLGMMLTGRAEIYPTKSGRGFAGVFQRFDTNLAPYWYIVQYGYPRSIQPRTHKVLALRDPDPHFWHSVQWFFGAPANRQIKVNKTSTVYHPYPRRKYRGHYYYEAPKGMKARFPVLLPSGKKFSMAMWREEHVEYTPAVSEGKIRTYALTVAPPQTQYRKEVRGQRASLFIERIIAKMAQKQKILTQSFFRAATAYLYAAADEWKYISDLMSRSGGLGG